MSDAFEAALENERALTDYFKNEALELREKLAALEVSGRDPAEVRPSDSRAESQAALNGPGGSPTSRPERVWSVRRGRWLMAYVTPVPSPCICPSHASNRGECPIHDDKGRVRLRAGQA